MSTNRLGRVENFDQFWRQNHLSSSNSRVELEGTQEPDSVEALEEISGYPYDGQDQYQGELKFHFSDWKERDQIEEGEYEYRAESGLLLLQLESERVDPEQIIQTLNDQLGGSTSIKDSISVKREALWKFFEEADQYDELTVTGPEGRFDFTTFKQVASRISPSDLDDFESLEALEDNPNVHDPEAVWDVKPLLEKTDLDREINSIEDLGIEPAKYFIERGVVHFEFRDELVSVTYDRGNLRINDDASETGREYVTQLFEKEVVYPSYGR